MAANPYAYYNRIFIFLLSHERPGWRKSNSVAFFKSFPPTKHKTYWGFMFMQRCCFQDIIIAKENKIESGLRWVITRSRPTPSSSWWNAKVAGQNMNLTLFQCVFRVFWMLCLQLPPKSRFFLTIFCSGTTNRLGMRKKSWVGYQLPQGWWC